MHGIVNMTTIDAYDDCVKRKACSGDLVITQGCLCMMCKDLGYDHRGLRFDSCTFGPLDQIDKNCCKWLRQYQPEP